MEKVAPTDIQKCTFHVLLAEDHQEWMGLCQNQTGLVHDEYYKCCIIAYNSYKRMLNEGIAREVARGVLPLTIFSTGYLTINARSLMNLLSLRRNTDNSAYPSYPMREIEIVAEQLEDEWAKLMPVTHECFNQYGRVAP